eukprot:COSAG02_NODE_5805_length_4024_cov_3.059873_1_plen_85_part_00
MNLPPLSSDASVSFTTVPMQSVSVRFSCSGLLALIRRAAQKEAFRNQTAYDRRRAGEVREHAEGKSGELARTCARYRAYGSSAL